MTLPMGPSTFALPPEKLSYMQSRLAGRRRLVRWAVVGFILLIIPALLFVSVDTCLNLTLTGLLGGFVLRNIDSFFGQIFGASAGRSQTSVSADVSTAVPFVFPFVLLVLFWWISDLYTIVIITVQMAIHGVYVPSVSLTIQILVFLTRSIVLVRLIPVARMIMDPDYLPSSTLPQDQQVSGASSELLTRNRVSDTTRFTRFQGSGNTLQPSTAGSE